MYNVVAIHVFRKIFEDPFNTWINNVLYLAPVFLNPLSPLNSQLLTDTILCAKHESVDTQWPNEIKESLVAHKHCKTCLVVDASA